MTRPPNGATVRTTTPQGTHPPGTVGVVVGTAAGGGMTTIRLPNGRRLHLYPTEYVTIEGEA